ncbi:response regulator transcription factor [Leucobacter insecticola]|uniref:Response regulator transcription factor n=1 Tax=Leucobacter insecticola TaxID=2714934 RepID=A0A6G8FK32_9MICO|nr:response regulator transcription factor [Leucobacter insecticola]QIM16708.1 response regulator transcription factor [Leucobacter insecticola]
MGEHSQGQDPLRVVVVDDQPLERAGIALILDSDDSIEVVGEAGSGEDALDAVARQKPDIVLMDVRMPGMGGIEATRRITERDPGVRVIVLTTFDLDEAAFGSLRAGASAFLLKSIRPAALVDAVQTVAAGSAVAAPSLTSKLIEHFLAGNNHPVGPRSDALGRLSPREREIFAAVVRGRSNPEIAEELFLAHSTVKSHVNAIFAKLHLRDRVHAVILGYELGYSPESGSAARRR